MKPNRPILSPLLVGLLSTSLIFPPESAYALRVQQSPAVRSGLEEQLSPKAVEAGSEENSLPDEEQLLFYVADNSSHTRIRYQDGGRLHTHTKNLRSAIGKSAGKSADRVVDEVDKYPAEIYRVPDSMLHNRGAYVGPVTETLFLGEATLEQADPRLIVGVLQMQPGSLNRLGTGIFKEHVTTKVLGRTEPKPPKGKKRSRKRPSSPEPPPDEPSVEESPEEELSREEALTEGADPDDLPPGDLLTEQPVPLPPPISPQTLAIKKEIGKVAHGAFNGVHPPNMLGAVALGTEGDVFAVYSNVADSQPGMDFISLHNVTSADFVPIIPDPRTLHGKLAGSYQAKVPVAQIVERVKRRFPLGKPKSSLIHELEEALNVKLLELLEKPEELQRRWSRTVIQLLRRVLDRDGKELERWSASRGGEVAAILDRIRELHGYRQELIQSIVRQWAVLRQSTEGEEVPSRLVRAVFASLLEKLDAWPWVKADAQALVEVLPEEGSKNSARYLKRLVVEIPEEVRIQDRHALLLTSPADLLAEIYYDAHRQVSLEAVGQIGTELEAVSGLDLTALTCRIFHFARSVSILEQEATVTELVREKAVQFHGPHQTPNHGVSAVGVLFLDSENRPRKFVPGGGASVEVRALAARYSASRIKQWFKPGDRIVLLCPSSSGFPNLQQLEFYLEDSFVLDWTIPGHPEVYIGGVRPDGSLWVWRLAGGLASLIKVVKSMTKTLERHLRFKDVLQRHMRGPSTGGGRSKWSPPGAAAVRVVTTFGTSNRVTARRIDPNVTMLLDIARDLPDVIQEGMNRAYGEGVFPDLSKTIRQRFRDRFAQLQKHQKAVPLHQDLSNLIRDIELLVAEAGAVIWMQEERLLEPVEIPGLTEADSPVPPAILAASTNNASVTGGAAAGADASTAGSDAAAQAQAVQRLFGQLPKHPAQFPKNQRAAAEALVPGWVQDRMSSGQAVNYPAFEKHWLAVREEQLHLDRNVETEIRRLNETVLRWGPVRSALLETAERFSGLDGRRRQDFQAARERLAERYIETLRQATEEALHPTPDVPLIRAARRIIVARARVDQARRLAGEFPNLTEHIGLDLAALDRVLANLQEIIHLQKLDEMEQVPDELVRTRPLVAEFPEPFGTRLQDERRHLADGFVDWLNEQVGEFFVAEPFNEDAAAALLGRICGMVRVLREEGSGNEAVPELERQRNQVAGNVIVQLAGDVEDAERNPEFNYTTAEDIQRKITRFQEIEGAELVPGFLRELHQMVVRLDVRRKQQCNFDLINTALLEDPLDPTLTFYVLEETDPDRLGVEGITRQTLIEARIRLEQAGRQAFPYRLEADKLLRDPQAELALKGADPDKQKIAEFLRAVREGKPSVEDPQDVKRAAKRRKGKALNGQEAGFFLEIDALIDSMTKSDGLEETPIDWGVFMDPSDAVRREAAQQLLQRGAGAVPVLIEAFARDLGETRVALVRDTLRQLVHNHGQPVLNLLLNAVENEDSWVQPRGGALALGSLYLPGTHEDPGLRELLETNRPEIIRTLRGALSPRVLIRRQGRFGGASAENITAEHLTWGHAFGGIADALRQIDEAAAQEAVADYRRESAEYGNRLAQRVTTNLLIKIHPEAAGRRAVLDEAARKDLPAKPSGPRKPRTVKKPHSGLEETGIRHLLLAASADLQESEPGFWNPMANTQREPLVDLIRQDAAFVRETAMTGKPLVLLLDEALTDMDQSALAEMGLSFLRLGAYPFVTLEIVAEGEVGAKMDRYRSGANLTVHLSAAAPPTLESGKTAPDAVYVPPPLDTVYVLRPNPDQPIPGKILPVVITGALAKLTQAKSERPVTAHSHSYRQDGSIQDGSWVRFFLPRRVAVFDAGPYLSMDLRTVTIQDIWQILADAFA